MGVIFQKSKKGRRGVTVPGWFKDVKEEIPSAMMRTGLETVEAGEVDVVRHYTALSQMNFGVDSGMYPLGSCTMKYNPKIKIGRAHV